MTTKLIPALNALGFSVSTVKHAHKGFEIDRPGKDSYRHREAGAQEVLVTSPHRWVLLHELRSAAEPSLDDLLRRLAPVDLALVEGFGRDQHPKIEVWRNALGKGLRSPDDPTVVAVATEPNAPPPGCSAPLLDINDADAIAQFIVEQALAAVV